MYKCVAVAAVQSFVERCMRAVGTDPLHSTALSQVLTEADFRGHFTHGLNRLGESCGFRAIQILKYERNRVTEKYKLGCPGSMSTRANYFPGITCLYTEPAHGFRRFPGAFERFQVDLLPMVLNRLRAVPVSLIQRTKGKGKNGRAAIFSSLFFSRLTNKTNKG